MRRFVTSVALISLAAFGPAAFGSVLAPQVPAAPTSYDSPLLLNPVTNTHLAIEGSAGTGANTAYLVVDFAYTHGGTYAWAYHFDGTKNGLDMIAALAALTPTAPGSGLQSQSTFWPGTGTCVDNFAYPAYAEAGDINNYWFEQDGTVAAGTVQWTDGMGAEAHTLSDGAVEGWYNGFGYGDIPQVYSRIPVVPEPASCALLGLGASLLLSRRRAR